MTRRQALAQTGLLAGAAWLGASFKTSASATKSADPKSSFSYCLNTGTIRGQKLGLLKEIEIAAQAGYNAIEPWVEAIDRYAKTGASLSELKKRIQDLGLTVESAISFPEWIVDDPDRRARGLERARRDMDLVSQIGGKRIAAPPAGATEAPGLDLLAAAERYRALLEIGDQMGVLPMLEIWGFSKNLHRLGQCLMVAAEAGHAKASLLADVFHIYKGGSDFNGLKLVNGAAMPVFHINDYPGEPSKEKINDSYRVFPGDGVGPLNQILRDLHATGAPIVLSLELFNRKYYEMDPLEVARAGLAKMKTAVRQALG